MDIIDRLLVNAAGASVRSRPTRGAVVSRGSGAGAATRTILGKFSSTQERSGASYVDFSTCLVLEFSMFLH